MPSTLSKPDADLFYDLWVLILDFVNKRYSIVPHLKDIPSMKGKNALEPAEVKKIADQLWTTTEKEINDFLTTEDQALPQLHKDILSSWKRQITGRFVLIRHLKDGSIFSSVDAKDVKGEPRHGMFLVKGINSTWEELFPPEFFPLPVVVKATLLPFVSSAANTTKKDKAARAAEAIAITDEDSVDDRVDRANVIITDGLVQSFNIFMGPRTRKIYKNAYLQAKRDKAIFARL